LIISSTGISNNYLVDGDDAIVFCEAEEVTSVEAKLKQAYTDVKQEVVCKRAYELRDVEFCQTRLMDCEFPKMVREPERVLDGAFISPHHYNNHSGLKIMNMISQCEGYISDGVPITGAFFNHVRKRLAGIGLPRINPESSLWKRVEREKRSFRNLPPSNLARASFAYLYSITPEEQIRIEEEFGDMISKWEPPPSLLRGHGVAIRKGPKRSTC